MSFVYWIFLILIISLNCFAENLQHSPVKVPIIINNEATPVVHLNNVDLEISFDLSGTSVLSTVSTIMIIEGHHNRYKSGLKTLAEISVIQAKVTARLKRKVSKATVFIQVKKTTNLLDELSLKISGTDLAYKYRFGISLVDEKKVKGARIPGIATTPKGTLLAVYDARYDNSRDLQGHMDIALVRSIDGGQSWSPMKKIIDMGTWGGLPEKYNGVSDACILVDDKSGKVFVAGLWMHGVKDKSGQWIGAKGWNHQWRQGGSMPGLEPKETSQFMIVEPRKLSRKIS